MHVFLDFVPASTVRVENSRSLPAAADPPEAYGWREVWAGADVSNHVWLAYSGATIAPYSDMFSDGLRLRTATGFGEYSYTGERNAKEQSFSAQTGFADAPVGYLGRSGPLTAKAFVGISLAGGLAGRFFEDANDMHDPYATLCWLQQF